LFLFGFGTFRIPSQPWQTLGQYARWLEQAILREWSGLTQGWGKTDCKSTSMLVFDWEESRRDANIG
jgi:hypothetical protein